VAVLTASFSPPGASNGATVSASDTGDATAWNAVVVNGGGSAAFAYDNSHTRFGKALAAKMVSNAAASVVEWTTPYNGVTADFGRIYLYPSAIPSAATKFVTPGSGGVTLQIAATGALQIVNQSGVLGMSSTILSGQWYRIEWHFVFSTTTGFMEAKIFTSPDSATATETLTSASNLNNGSAGTSLLIGCNSFASWNAVWLQSAVARATAYPGPYPVSTASPVVSGSTPVGSLLTCDGGTWNGTFTLTYQWTRDGSNIGGATSSTYTTVSGDSGHNVGCTVTATGQQATNETATASSNTVAVGSTSSTAPTMMFGSY